MWLNFLCPKYDFNILSKFTLVETSLALKTQSNNFALQIQIHAQDNIKWIRTLIFFKIYYLYDMKNFYLYYLVLFVQFFDKNMQVMVFDA